MENIAIIAVGYNRPDSMKQLLQSLLRVDYLGMQVDLIISIDRGQRQSEIVEVAEGLVWNVGNKKLRVFPERQGLRSHIIQCGDYTEEYDAVVVLEDDLLVSPAFFSYVIQALRFYSNDAKIAGISLYRHYIHPGVNRPFEPENNGFDTFLMQYAMSWGQCWTREMWKGFRRWYGENDNADLSRDSKLPRYISNWNSHSWLKYYMRYIVETDKYFVYPYFSLTTNESILGEHCHIPNNDYQVPMQEVPRDYSFSSFNEAVKYDVFFERKGIESYVFPDLCGRKVMDLYGCRDDFDGAQYILSTRSLPFKLIQRIQLKYRPIEKNCIDPTDGDGIILYDARIQSKCPKLKKVFLIRYDVKNLHWKKLLYLGWKEFLYALSNKVRRKK